MKKLHLPHPGEILNEEFLKPMGISQYKLAKNIGVPPIRINEIVLGKRAISADTSLRLARYFGNSAQFWLNLQMHYDLKMASKKAGKKIIIQVKVLRPADQLMSDIRQSKKEFANGKSKILKSLKNLA